MNKDGAFSVLGFFDSAQSLMQAIPQVKSKAAAARIEAYSPFPIHGIDKALDLESLLFAAWFSRWELSARFRIGSSDVDERMDYPQITAGKPYFSWEAFVPLCSS